jgi:hypothetical protein
MNNTVSEALHRTYPHIDTCFKREMDKTSPYYNCIRPNEPLVDPVFDWARKAGIKFECTEKVDGTNMSIYIVPVTTTVYPADSFEQPYEKIDHYVMEVHGKTTKAQLNDKLVENIYRKWPVEKLVEVFTRDGVGPTDTIILYGEGYGAGIQKGGNYIKDNVDFRLFDVQIGKFWLERESLEDIAERLGMDIVPVIGYFTIDEAIEYVKKGFKSTIAQNKDYDAEGLVLKMPLGLLKRNGGRIMTKIKTCDFRALESAEERKALLEKKTAEKKVNGSL